MNSFLYLILKKQEVFFEGEKSLNAIRIVIPAVPLLSLHVHQDYVGVKCVCQSRYRYRLLTSENIMLIPHCTHSYRAHIANILNLKLYWISFVKG